MHCWTWQIQLDCIIRIKNIQFHMKNDFIFIHSLIWWMIQVIVDIRAFMERETRNGKSSMFSHCIKFQQPEFQLCTGIRALMLRILCCSVPLQLTSTQEYNANGGGKKMKIRKSTIKNFIYSRHEKKLSAVKHEVYEISLRKVVLFRFIHHQSNSSLNFVLARTWCMIHARDWDVLSSKIIRKVSLSRRFDNTRNAMRCEKSEKCLRRFFRHSYASHGRSERNDYEEKK